MYRAFGDALLSQMMANELVSPKRESINVANPGELFNTISNKLSSFVKAIQERRNMQPVPQPVLQVACQELPVYC